MVYLLTLLMLLVGCPSFMYVPDEHYAGMICISSNCGHCDDDARAACVELCEKGSGIDYSARKEYWEAEAKEYEAELYAVCREKHMVGMCISRNCEHCDDDAKATCVELCEKRHAFDNEDDENYVAEFRTLCEAVD